MQDGAHGRVGSRLDRGPGGRIGGRTGGQAAGLGGGSGGGKGESGGVVADGGTATRSVGGLSRWVQIRLA